MKQAFNPVCSQKVELTVTWAEAGQALSQTERNNQFNFHFPIIMIVMLINHRPCYEYLKIPGQVKLE